MLPQPALPSPSGVRAQVRRAGDSRAGVGGVESKDARKQDEILNFELISETNQGTELASGACAAPLLSGGIRRDPRICTSTEVDNPVSLALLVARKARGWLAPAAAFSKNRLF